MQPLNRSEEHWAMAHHMRASSGRRDMARPWRSNKSDFYQQLRSHGARTKSDLLMAGQDTIVKEGIEVETLVTSVTM